MSRRADAEMLYAPERWEPKGPEHIAHWRPFMAEALEEEPWALWAENSYSHLDLGPAFEAEVLELLREGK